MSCVSAHTYLMAGANALRPEEREAKCLGPRLPGAPSHQKTNYPILIKGCLTFRQSDDWSYCWEVDLRQLRKLRKPAKATSTSGIAKLELERVQLPHSMAERWFSAFCARSNSTYLLCTVRTQNQPSYLSWLL